MTVTRADGDGRGIGINVIPRPASTSPWTMLKSSPSYATVVVRPWEAKASSITLRRPLRERGRMSGSSGRSRSAAEVRPARR